MRFLTLLARTLISGTFFLSGMLKLMEPGGFLLDIQAFGLFPYVVAYVLALLVPPLEVVCSLLIWKRDYRNAAAAILAFMTLGFIALIVYEEWQGLNLNCGCFGNWLLFPSFYSHIGFNCILLAALLLNWEQSPKENA